MIVDMRCRPPYGQYLSYFAGMIPESKRPQAHLKGSMDLFFEEMKSAGITLAVAPGGVNHGLKLDARNIPPREVTNDNVAEVQKKYPQRIVGVGGIDPTGYYHDPVAEIKRCHELGLKGIFIEPGRSFPGCRLDDARLYPIYQTCSDLGMFINPQTSGPLGGTNVDYANPMYIDHVAEDFPNLTIICVHGCYPYVLEMITVCLRRQNVYAAPDIYVGLAGTNLWVEAINAKVGIFDFTSKFIFGTAYPYAELKTYTDWFLSLPFNDDVKENILYKNAMRAMKLDPKEYPGW